MSVSSWMALTIVIVWRAIPAECNGGAGALPTLRSRASSSAPDVKDSDGTIRNETFQDNCPHCRGYGKQTCPRCGHSQL